jgi:omega-6 fatty acid desaturase (delta-12 desaturase)
MEYSQPHVDAIRSHVRTGYATGFAEPTFYLATTMLLFFGILYAIHITKPKNIYLIVFLVVMLALMNLRLFIIFHDMCHRSFFPTDERSTDTKGFNFWVAQLIEPLCSFSAEYWNNTHSAHHKAHGNLNIHDNARSVLRSGDYDALSDLQKRIYGVARFPPLFFGVAPIYIYWLNRVIQQEWVWILKYGLLLGILHYLGGGWKLVLAFLGAQYLAGTMGIMLFHLQHHVNPGHWRRFDETDTLSKANAELNGSSVQRIPFWLEYFTNGIEYHNVHHSDPGVPSYNTKRVYYELVERGLIPDSMMSYYDEFVGLGNTLYDETRQIYI